MDGYRQSRRLQDFMRLGVCWPLKCHAQFGVLCTLGPKIWKLQYDSPLAEAISVLGLKTKPETKKDQYMYDFLLSFCIVFPTIGVTRIFCLNTLPRADRMTQLLLQRGMYSPVDGSNNMTRRTVTHTRPFIIQQYSATNGRL